jgi:hypothetical protein
LGGVQYSTQFISQNGAWYPRYINVSDINGTAEQMLQQGEMGRYPRLNNWDNEIRKRFKLGESGGSLEFTWDLFNTMNANTIQSWRSTNVSSALYLQPNKTPLQPATILAPRIYEWGVTYKF